MCVSASVADQQVQSPAWPSAQRMLYSKLVFTVPRGSMRPWKEPHDVSSRPRVLGWKYLVAIHSHLLLPAFGSLPLPGPVHSTCPAGQWGITVDRWFQGQPGKASQRGKAIETELSGPFARQTRKEGNTSLRLRRSSVSERNTL